MAHLDDTDTRRDNSRFIKRLMQAPMLTREEERELAERWRDDRDEQALHKLIAAYERLVVSIASRFRNYGLPYGDLIQEGNVGLLQAAERFDPERNVRFSTYAAWWVRSAVQDFVLRNWSLVRVGTTASQKSLFFNIRRLSAQAEQTSGGELGEDGRSQIAEELSVSTADVESMALRMARSDQSLNAPIGEDGEHQLQDLLVDDRPDPESAVAFTRDSASRSRWLAEALSQLSKREQRIIRERRLSEDGATLEQLGNALGVSKERVRQIEQRAMGTLRRALEDRVSDPASLT